MLNRRKLLAIGGVVGGAVLLPEGATRPVTATASGHEHLHHHPTTSPAVRTVRNRLAVEPFSVRMPLLPDLRPVRSTYDTDLYRMDIRPGTAEILPGYNTPIFGYNGSFVGPTIRARTGRKVKVTFANQLDRPANVHLHGGHVAAVDDGHPMDIIDPGASRLYNYPNTQQGATLWYHDHSHHTEAENVYRGLHGFYLIDDPSEWDLRLPRGGYDVPILLRDALFDGNGTMLFGGNPAERNVALANGVPAPYFPVAARKYRFRLLNGGTERTFRLTLGNGEEMIQIGTDGGLLPAPVARTGLRISSAERVEVVIDFAKYPVGTKLVLADSVMGPVLRFDVVRQTYDFSRVPARLRPIPALPPATNERNVTLSFDMTSGPFPIGLVNGQPYNPDRSDFVIKRGTTEIWNVTNADPAVLNFLHTFHVHLVQFKILSRNGGPPGPDDIGRKDTFFFAPGETVRLQATFGNHLGKYAYHCHFLEHSTLGMMAQMEIVA